LRARLGFIFLSKLYRQMYAGTGISTDSARRKKSKAWARWTARQCKRLFRARPMPELSSPVWDIPGTVAKAAFAGAAQVQLPGPFLVIPKD
jgi:hypothetical protein